MFFTHSGYFMKSKVLVLAALPIVGMSATAGAHEFKNGSSFYGNFRVNLGYQMGIDQQFVNNSTKDPIKEFSKDNDGIGNDYNNLTPLTHKITLGALYNVYYKNSSDIFHPFVGAGIQLNIPVAAWETVEKTGKIYYNKQAIYDFLEVNLRAGVKIKAIEGLAIEPYVGYGKTLAVIVSKTHNGYIDKDTRTYGDLNLLDTYYAGIDFVIKEKFSIGVGYKFLDMSKFNYVNNGDTTSQVPGLKKITVAGRAVTTNTMKTMHNHNVNIVLGYNLF